jgi:osmotically inducible protein OsmC
MPEGPQFPTRQQNKIMKRIASAVWNGDLKQGKGTLTTQGGALSQTPYSFAARFEQGAGTNPEELIAAAHAGCFTMQLSAFLTQAGFVPTQLSTRATLALEQVEGTWTITTVHLDLTALIPGITREKFESIAADAKAKCPVSRVLNATITLSQQLIAG